MDLSLTLKRAYSRNKVEDLQTQANPPKKRVGRFLIVLVVLGLAVNLLLPQVTNLTSSLEVVRKMTWWAVGLSFVAELASYLSYGYCLHAILDIHGQKLNVLRGGMIAMASYSIGLVAGGWVAAAAATFGYARKEGSDPSTSTMAGVLPSVLINGAIILVAAVGTIFLFFTHQLSQSQLIQYSIFMVILTVISFGAFIGLNYPETAYKVLNWALWNVARLRKKPYNPEQTRSLLNSFIASWRDLGEGNWLKPLLGAMGYIVLDMLAMFFLFVASGFRVNPGVLAAGYGLPLLLSKMAFFFPGGLGVVEASMTALFTSLGVPDGISVVVVIGYRLVSFWIPTLLGFLMAAILGRSNGRAQPALKAEQSLEADPEPKNVED